VTRPQRNHRLAGQAPRLRRSAPSRCLERQVPRRRKRAIGGSTAGWSPTSRMDGRPSTTTSSTWRDTACSPGPSFRKVKNTVRVEFAPEEAGYGKPAAVMLLVDGKQVGAGRVEKAVPVGYSAEGFDVGMDNISAVSPDCKAPFAFAGKGLDPELPANHEGLELHRAALSGATGGIERRMEIPGSAAAELRRGSGLCTVACGTGAGANSAGPFYGAWRPIWPVTGHVETAAAEAQRRRTGGAACRLGTPALPQGKPWPFSGEIPMAGDALGADDGAARAP
jgi:hypothetical protein